MSGKTNPFRKASPPVTPPAKTGIISIGRNANRAQRLDRPADPSFPTSTSKALTRVSNSKPSVPSRLSQLITSAVNRQAAQLPKKAALTNAFKRLRPIPPGAPSGHAHINWGSKTSAPTSPTAKRDQYVARLRARMRSSRSRMGKMVMRSAPSPPSGSP